MGWFRRIFPGPDRGAERRRYPRYPVSAPVEMEVGGETLGCRLENVSAGGVRLTPPVAVPTGTAVTVRHAASGLALRGRVVGQGDGGTRVRFDSEDAGIVVSSWLRMAEDGEGGGDTRSTG
ncbi:MAG TPA: PilZ domain-containing protein [Thalassobaculum sp.]